MGFLSWLTQDSSPEASMAREASAKRQVEILQALRADRVPAFVAERLQDSVSGKRPWIATLTPSELMIARAYDFKPIAVVRAACTMLPSLNTSVANMQLRGWEAALRRLRTEAIAAGANAVLDVKMRSTTMRSAPLRVDEAVEFLLVGTAMRVAGFPPSEEPLIATLPALEFIQLLKADIVPSGIAIGAHDEWIPDPRKNILSPVWMENIEYTQLSELMTTARKSAATQMRRNAYSKGNVVLALAHVHHSQLIVGDVGGGRAYIARHVVVATTIDRGGRKRVDRRQSGQGYRELLIPQEFKMVVDLHAAKTPLANAGGKEARFICSTHK
jgi:uncharacterized protein YbjQ (UPF0145 family)